MLKLLWSNWSNFFQMIIGKELQIKKNLWMNIVNLIPWMIVLD